jgi:hypothetical protein
MATRTKLINPGPAALMVVNPKGGGSMRKKHSTRRGTRRKLNPGRGTRRFMGSRAATRLSRSMRARRNPQFNLGLIREGLTLAAGGGLTQFVTGMVPPLGGVSPLADAARTAGVAYLLGMVAEKFGMGRFSREITLGGMAVAGAKVINSFVVPSISQVFSPREMPASAAGVKGIAMQTPGMFPYGLNGLNGIAVQTPGAIPFADYAPEMSN